MNNSRKYVNVIASILLVITVIFTILSGFVRFVATNKYIYLKLLENSNTYCVVEEALSNKMSKLLGNDISEDLKKSIITEEDIRKEADTVLDCMLSDLISGQANIPEIDTSIYKERIADALKSLTGYDVKINNNDLAINIQLNDYYVTPINSISNSEELIGENMFAIKKLNKAENNDAVLFNMATRAELEAQGRAMLKERGITEEEARQKAAAKGISEEDVWNYLEQNGYLDDESESNNSEDSSKDGNSTDNNNEDTSNIQKNSEIESQTNENSTTDSLNNDNDDTKVSKKKIQNIVTSVILDDSKNFDEKLEEISLKLMDEAGKIVDAEMEKLNFSKVIDSSEFKAAIKATSLLYNNFYVILSLLIIVCALLIFINKESITNGVIIISRSIIASGIIMSLIFGSIYLSKIYTHINMSLNKDYFEPMFLQTAQYFSKTLSIISITILLIGLIANISMMKKRIN